MEVASHGQCYSKVSLSNPISTTSLHKRHAFGKKRAPLRRRIVLQHTLHVQSQAGFGRGTVKIKEGEELEEEEPEPVSGTRKFFKLPVPPKLPGTVKLQNKNQSRLTNNKVVFVAGATGKVGSRTVRELLKLGFSVRASTRNVEKAQALFEDAQEGSSSNATGSDDANPFGMFSPAKLFGFLKPKAAGRKLEIVECDLENQESIGTALGNAGVVVCCIGASEKEVLDVTGPYRIDYKATENLINAASAADVSHFVLITSLGTQKIGFPAAVLNLFWGVLVWKAKAEKALIQSGIPYTIVRPGGMERPTDAYKETHNLILGEADKLFGGQVSNLQVAELLASIVENPDVSVDKIVEAIAETTAPLRPIREMLEEISAKESSSPAPPSIKMPKPVKADANAQKTLKKQEEEKLVEEKRAQLEQKKEDKKIQAERDAKEKVKLQELRQKYEKEIEAAREKEEAAKRAAAAALAEKAELEKKAAEIRAKAESAALAASQAKAVEAAVLAAARKGEVLSDVEKEKIIESVRLARLPKEAAPVAEPSKPSLKKKPSFSFLRGAAPFSKTATEIEPIQEQGKEKVSDGVEAKTKVKADKKAVADRKQEEENLKKEEEGKKVAEAKKKEEQERAEIEAKERVEKTAAEAKLKEQEEEAKQKAEAEAKKKDEEKARREEEEEARRKEEEIAKAKQKEEEERAKEAEAEENAKVLAEEEASKKIEEEQAPRRKGFRWFWQPEESEMPEVPEEEVVDIPESIEGKVIDVPVAAGVINQLPPCPTPLSPYTRYPGLKPPSPPFASPPAPKAESPPPVASNIADVVSPVINTKDQILPKVAPPPVVVIAEEPSKESEDDIAERKKQILETEAREREALEKAQATSPFKWFWENSDSTGEESASTLKEEKPAAAVQLASSVPDEPAVALPPTPTEETTDTLSRSSRPLSPYAQFPNLKPPSPPKAFSVPQNGPAVPSKPEEMLPRSSTPLSPYAGFPDLKPPTSPSPLVGNGAVPAAAKHKEEKAEELKQAEEPIIVTSGFKWPWQQ